MRRVLFLTLATVLFAGAAPAAPVQAAVPKIEKIAIVDVQRCLMETKEGRAAKKDLERTFSKGQVKLDAKAKKLESKLRDLQAKASMLSQAELMKRQQELMRSQSELQQLGMQLQEEVANKEALLTEKIYNKVSAIVKQVALEDGVQVVLVRSELTVLYASPKLDLTNRVIVRYDKQNSKK